MLTPPCPSSSSSQVIRWFHSKLAAWLARARISSSSPLASWYSSREMRRSMSASSGIRLGFHDSCAPMIMPGMAMRGSLTWPKSPQSVMSMPCAWYCAP